MLKHEKFIIHLVLMLINTGVPWTYNLQGSYICYMCGLFIAPTAIEGP